MGEIDDSLAWWLICIFLFAISSSSTGNESTTRDSLINGEKLDVNHTITSKGGYFQLGFFSSTNDSNTFYLGIRFLKAASYPIVWVANRANPLFTTSSVLTFQQNGNLVIMDDNGKVNSFFVTNVSLLDNKNARMILLDSGNLVLQDEESTIVWQSFDFPTNTILPGMKIGYNKTSRNTWSYRSWKNVGNPSPGKFTAVFDPNQSGWVFIRKRNQINKLSWLGLSNSATHVYSIRSKHVYFSTHVDPLNNTFYGVIDVDDDDKDFFVMFVLESSGFFQGYYWFKDDPDWTKLMQLPNRICDSYAYCGNFAVCNSNSSNACSCFQGYHPSDPQNWGKQNYSGGCERTVAIGCTKADIILDEKELLFEKLPNVTLPSNPILMPGLQKIKDCELACAGNCSCNGYSYTENRCWIIAQDATNVQYIPNNDVPGVDIYIKVSASDLLTISKNNNDAVSFGPVLSGWALFIISSIALILATIVVFVMVFLSSLNI